MSQLSWSFAQIRNRFSHRVGRLYASDLLLWVIICFGIVLRFAQYQANWSLMQGEARLAVNIVDRTFSELTQPLDYNQAAPIGFLVVEKLAIQALGNSEYALRLFPFLSGIASLFLFYTVAKSCLGPNAVRIALGLFSISEPLIYYSAAVKQYSSDVTIGLLLFWVAVYIRSKRLSAPRVVLFGVVGAIAIWFSHPSLFVLAGIGGSLALFCLVRKEWTRIGQLLIAFLFWAVSFAIVYSLSLGDLGEHENLLRFWGDSFMPFPPLSFSEVKWFVDTFFVIFEKPVGLILSGVAAFAFIIGGISTFSKEKEGGLVLLSPILLALLASGLHKYPFHGRLLLFAVPTLLLFIAEGTERVLEKTKPASAVIGITLVGLLFFPPLLSASYHLVKPRTFVAGYPIREEIKPVMDHVRRHQQEEDILYLYYSTWNAFKYYQQRYGYKDGDYITGVVSKDDWSGYASDLDKLKGNDRVWILFSHFQGDAHRAEKQFYEYYLDSIGTRLDAYESEGAAAYLYDLGE